MEIMVRESVVYHEQFVIWQCQLHSLRLAVVSLESCWYSFIMWTMLKRWIFNITVTIKWRIFFRPSLHNSRTRRHFTRSAEVLKVSDEKFSLSFLTRWSFRGRSLWAVALSAYAPREHVLLRPEVKYIGNMHGNEVVGLEMLLHLIEYLLTSSDPQVRLLMQRTRIWIMPSMNPDGLVASEYGDCSSSKGRFAFDLSLRKSIDRWNSSRFTSTNIDLNRNFPDYFEINPSSSGRAPETLAIMDWLSKIHFVLSANYHGGAFIINIPYDRYCKCSVIAPERKTRSFDFLFPKISEKFQRVRMTTFIKCSAARTSIESQTRTVTAAPETQKLARSRAVLIGTKWSVVCRTTATYVMERWKWRWKSLVVNILLAMS